MSKRREYSAHSSSIDGLRSVAILPVIVWHGFPELLPGGFIGVDIFFVISGFLISSMIADQALAGQYSIRDFYKRRILRIFPAFFFVLVVSFAAGWWLLPPLQFSEFGQALFAASVFASNLLFWMKSGYFDAAAESNPLVHTWSLAVEEQFYLVAPLIAFLVIRNRSHLYRFFALVSAISLIFAEFTNDVVPSSYFFFTINRMFELCIGGMAGCAVRSRQMGELNAYIARLPLITIELLSALGFAALIWSFFAFGPQSHHPGTITLIPVLATAALLMLNDFHTLVHRVLSLKILVIIGLISYSLYLIHHPLLAFARILYLGDTPSTILTICLLASIALAYLSWRFVETPFRNYSRFSTRRVFFGAATIIGAGLITGYAIYALQGVPQRYGEAVIDFTRPPSASSLDYDTSGLPSGSRIVLWGDSHAKMLTPSLQEWTSRTGGTVDLKSHGGCPPILGFDNDWRNLKGPKCSEHNQQVFESLLKMDPGATVVIVARWANYLRAPEELDEFGHHWSLASRSIFPANEDSWSGTVTSAAGRALDFAADQLILHGHRVVLIGPLPIQRLHADDLGFMLRGDQVAIHALATKLSAHSSASSRAIEMLRTPLSNNPETVFVDPASLLCKEGVCSYMLQGRMAYRDDNHLNDWGAMPIARTIMQNALPTR